jgi:hypothetical protein
VNDAPDAIERELEQTRARLGDHLDELTSRLSPGQLVDEALMYARDGQAAAFVRNLGASVRDNPLPVAVVGAGLLWLAFASARPPSGNGYNARGADWRGKDWRDRQDNLAERARRTGESLTRGIDETQEAFEARVAEARGRVLGLTQHAQETAATFMTRVQDAFQAAQDRAGQGWRQAQETARGWTEGVSNAVRQGSDTVSEMASHSADWSNRANRTVVSTMQDNPLLIGILGLLAGGAVGSLLPLTNSETNLLREPARQAADAARAAKDELVNRATHAANAAARAGMDAAAHPEHDRPVGSC